MRAFALHFALEFRTALRNKQLVFLNFLFPLGFYLMMGFIMGGINPGFLPDIIPAMAVFAILAAALLGIPEPLVSGRERGIFRSYKVNGVPAFSILAVPALSTMAQLLVVAAIITVTAPLLFGAPLPADWAAFFTVFLTAAFACVGLGSLIGVVSANTRASVLWSQLVFVPAMLLGGMMLPHSALPEVAGRLAQLLPATHAMNAFRALAMGKTADFSPWGSVVVLAISGLLAFGLALYLFRWDSRETERRRSPLLALLYLLPSVVGIFLLS
jgi:ABC-2 type transport system permease protein